ncbi:TPA: glycosyltransferase family 2 protein [Yersinia enterocolitica]|uniref:glycosyltransferase family 2 protein n=1 Tax=Yersinia enterocolitica TaxID=630 RepID=UPI001C66C6D3|nr:glycosyltransferase family 2 protein [Yersinia enterocolitica]MBW5835396.1 glycosyltransferase family 2 protein [Yersinia enterocolitica]MBX9475047.1 glycosyltransferase family 2 protein [Yersinia enterocolitica]MBX9489766.1 glycosyltransferase family 2 protein [Yersinia enterocolitica]MBX9494100.1 glycosyltransferase family 2 protein [Yersinia enterocolitica]HEN3566554.1 glycosyltransferase family 2 protein [Yersinia enterocolitica]
MSVTPFAPCLVIPCFNHGGTMAGVLSQLAIYQLPCLIIDDGSGADTANELARLAAEYSWVVLVTHPENRGKGNAVLNGLAVAQKYGYSHGLQVDADGQHHLSDIPIMLVEAEKHPHCLISGRPIYDKSVPKARLYGRYITHFWVWIETLSLSLKDSMCGFRVYPVAETLAVAAQYSLGARMDFDTEVMVKLYWQGTESRFLPTKVTYPENGISHFDALHDNLRISWMHTRLFFGMLPRIPTLLKRHLQKPENHWSQTKERSGLWGMRLMLRSYKILGRTAFNLMLYPVISYFWLTGHRQRKASILYLQRLVSYAKQQNYPLPTSLNSFRHFMRFGESMLDKLASWQGDLVVGKDVVLVGRERCEAQIATRQGSLILASHLGDIESCRALAELSVGVKVNALVFTHHAARFNQVMKEINPHALINLIQVTSIGPDTAILLRQKLDEGEWVAIVGDRTSVSPYQRDNQPRVIWSSFLGYPAPFPIGPFALAAALRCPVFLMFGLKLSRQAKSMVASGVIGSERSARLHVYFEPFADPLILPRATRQSALQNAVNSYAARLEHYSLLAPLDWFNFYDFWHLNDGKPNQGNL